MPRRAQTVDPALMELRAELGQRLPSAPTIPRREGDRRRAVRRVVDAPARMRVADLTLIGRIRDVGSGGVFFSSDLLVEVGERGVVALERNGVVDFENGIPARVAWTRPMAHRAGAGMGLAFEFRDERTERRAVELLLALLDEAERS